MSQDPTHQIQRKTAGYWYIDGLAEMIGGCIILLVRLTYLLTAFVPPQTEMLLLVVVVQPSLIIAGVMLGGRGIRSLKERITYPRTGYVAYRTKPKHSRARRALLGFAVSLVTVLIVTALIPYLGDNWIPLFTSLAMALFIAWIGWRADLGRFYLVAGLLFGLGALVTYLRTPQPYNTALILGGLGAALIVSGALTLRHYLRHTQPAPPAAEGS